MLMYFRWRPYKPDDGIFLTRDPVGYHDGMSIYLAYFPPAGTDPMGLVWDFKIDGGRKIARWIQDGKMTPVGWLRSDGMVQIGGYAIPFNTLNDLLSQSDPNPADGNWWLNQARQYGRKGCKPKDYLNFGEGDEFSFWDAYREGVVYHNPAHYLLYTGSLNPTDGELWNAYGAAGKYAFERGAFEGAYIQGGIRGKTFGGGMGLEWTITGGRGVYGLMGAQSDDKMPTSQWAQQWRGLNGLPTRPNAPGVVGVGVKGTWNESGFSADRVIGIAGFGGHAAFGMDSRTLAFGLGSGKVQGGIVVRPERLPGMFMDAGSALISIFQGSF